MRCMSYDVLIVGAGAAGCVAAANLPDGIRALLIDRRRPDWPRCCGGLLSPDAQDALIRLGLRLPDDVCVDPEPNMVRVRDLDSGLAQKYRRDYKNIDRALLDAWLLKLARKRVKFQEHTRFAAVERERAGLVARVIRRGREERVKIRTIIGADGAQSTVRRASFPRYPSPRSVVAIQATLNTDDPPTAHEVLFSSRHTDFYAWAIPKTDAVLVGSAFDVTQGALARFEVICKLMCELFSIRGSVKMRSARRLTRPCAPRELLAGNNAVLLTGEAAGLISPSSGEGLSFAIESGSAAGKAIAGAFPFGTYQPMFRRLARRVTRKFVKARVIFSPALRRLALRLPWCP